MGIFLLNVNNIYDVHMFSNEDNTKYNAWQFTDIYSTVICIAIFLFFRKQVYW